jgi:membrane protease subunit HflK
LKPDWNNMIQLRTLFSRRASAQAEPTNNLPSSQEMAWNEPGNSNDKDPWSGGGRKQDGPPDLDEVARKLQDAVGRVLGGGKKRSGGSSGGGDRSGGGSGNMNMPSLPIGGGAIAILALVLWGLSGIYIIDPAERGVVMRFGQYVDTTMPGPHWHFPYPIESLEKVNVEEIRNAEIGYRSGGRAQNSVGVVSREALMLTQDENIISVQLAVQYRIKDAKDYLFNVVEPDLALRAATESALRETIGKSKMDFVLTEGRADIAAQVQSRTQEILDLYVSGLQITSVNMQDAQPPDEVQAAFADVVKAREDRQRLVNEAQAYANDIIPRARGAAARIVAEAEAYREQIVADAEGTASRFDQVLTEYKKAPDVTRERLYLDTMEKVLSSSSKVVVDLGSNNLTVLPLDKMLGGALPSATGSTGSNSATVNSTGGASSSVLDRVREEVSRRVSSSRPDLRNER